MHLAENFLLQGKPAPLREGAVDDTGRYFREFDPGLRINLE